LNQYLLLGISVLVFLIVYLFIYWYNGGSFDEDLEMLNIENTLEQAKLETENAVLELENNKRQLRT